jgi:hypothetical protein
MNETTQILKVDEVGRVRTPREKQEEVLDGYERSGMTGMQFAKHAGVKYPTLMYWVQRRRRERQESASPVTRPQWLEAVVESEEQGEGLVVEAPGGLRLIVKEGGQVKMAGELLRVLGFGQPC